MRDHSRFEDRMTLFADTRHTLALGIVVLLLFTAIAPLCLMPTEQAMAMSMSWSGEQISYDCDAAGGESGPMAGCEFHDRDDIPATAPSPQAPIVALAALPQGGIDAVDHGAPVPLDSSRASSPVAPPTPLRL